MLVYIDVSDLQLGANHLFRQLEPHLLDCAINYCASYRYMSYEKFHTEMIEYLFDNSLYDEDMHVDHALTDRINDLEEHEFNMLVMICYTIYQRVTQYYAHIWQVPTLKESVLVGYEGQLHEYRMIIVDIEIDAPDHLLHALHNRKAFKKQRRKQDLTYIPKGI